MNTQDKKRLTTQEKEQLNSTLWDIADQLRGSMNADDFRDYMLSLLFFRHLSAKYEAAARKELGSDCPEGKSYAEWCEENEGDVKEFEAEMRKKIHYVIAPQYLWSSIYELARTQDDDLLKVLGESFSYIENESFGSTFQGLFSEINLASEKLGKDYSGRNKLVGRVVVKLEESLKDFDETTDYLGDAYEYLIGQFAAGSGKKAGEFYTPQMVSTILSRIVTLDCQDPSTGRLGHLDSVLDFACGSGSLLLNVHNQIESYGGTVGKIYGQEKNVTTYNLARMNMLLHNLKDTEFEIYHGDTLTNDWELLREANPARRVHFDAVVANPPFSLKWEPTDKAGDDFRYKDYGVAPRSAADFAFLLHGFSYLSEKGTMAIILPHGVLFRGGAEERIRTKLINDDSIDCIIGLPGNLFFSTGIPVCIIVLKKCRRHSDVLFINASEQFTKGKKQNKLEKKHIDKIIDTYQYRREEERYSRRVSLTEIRDNGYNLNITRYVSLRREEAQVDLHEVHQRLHDIADRAQAAREAHNRYLRELGLEEI